MLGGLSLWASHRALLLTALATLACMRVNPVARLQVCDLWFDYLTSYGVPGFEGRARCTSIGGRTTRLGKGITPPSAARRVLRSTSWCSCGRGCGSPGWQFILLAKRTRPAARCEVCPPLFPLTRCAQGGVTVATDRPCSRQQASDWIRLAVAQAGSDSTRFSGISARKGGISAAIEARVDEAILYLQSGHGQALPARAYMYLTSPARFLETFEAFAL